MQYVIQGTGTSESSNLDPNSVYIYILKNQLKCTYENCEPIAQIGSVKQAVAITHKLQF